MEKANQDEEKGYGSTQTQEEEGKAAWAEAQWYKSANVKSGDKYKNLLMECTAGPNSREAIQDGSSICCLSV